MTRTQRTDRRARHTQQPRHIYQHRAGFSLIEVILATAILMGSVIVLSELAGIGRRQAQRGRELSEAQSRCEQVVIELLTGLRPFGLVELEPLLSAEQRFLEQADFDLIDGTFNEFDPFARDRLNTADLSADASDQESDWLYSVRVEPLSERPGLALLTVTVEQSPERFPRPIRFALSRWIDDPSPDLESEPGAIGSQESFAAPRGGLSP